MSTFLRDRRVSRSITTADLAEQLGVHPNSVLRWERGDRLPGPGHITRLARTLAIETVEVVGFFDGVRPPAERIVESVRGHGLRPLRHSELRRLRRRTGPSQQVVARRIGTGRHSLGAWERGQQPPLVAVRRLATVYGVPVARVARAAGVTPPAQLAERCGCSTSAVRVWERGQGEPGPALRHRLEGVYGLPEESLLTAYRPPC